MGLIKGRDDLAAGYQLGQQAQALSLQCVGHHGYASHIAARPIEAGDKSDLDRITSDAEDDRNCRRRGLGRKCGKIAASRRQHRHLPSNEIGR